MRFRPCGRLVSLPAFSLAPKRVHHERRLRQRVRRRHDDQHDDRQGRIKVMKFLLSSVAIVAALAIASPVSAQGYGPGPGARTGTGPGVNPPGGPGPSSPLSNLPAGSPGLPGTPAAQYPGSPAAISPVPVPGVAPPGTTSAEPPAPRQARASTHHKGMKAHPPEAMTGTTAAQLNQEELARLQSGNFSNPPAPPGPQPSASNPETGPGRATRRARGSSN